MKIKNKIISSFVLTQEELQMIHDLKNQTNHSMSKIIGCIIRHITKQQIIDYLQHDFDSGIKPEVQKNKNNDIRKPKTTSLSIKKNKHLIVGQSSKNKKGDKK